MSTMLDAAERLLEDRRPADAIHITQLLWQQSPQNYGPLHVKALMALRQFDHALHVLSLFPSSSTFHKIASMQCCFELGDTRACCANAEALLQITQEAATGTAEQHHHRAGYASSFHGAGGGGGGGGDDNGRDAATPGEPFSPSVLKCGITNDSAGKVNVQVLALCYLGRCAELVADAAKAVGHYKHALELDPFCTSAMHTLIDHRLLQPQQLTDVIESLGLPEDAEGLRQHFINRVATANMDHAPIVRTEDIAAAQAATSPPGQLTSSALVHLAAAEHSKNHLQEAARLVTAARERTPFDKDALCVQLSILVDQKATATLFDVAHSLTKHRGLRAGCALYAIGCYYYSLCNYERAGRYFCRATELDPAFVEAWVAFGHCYAKLEEGEQALAVYRRALHMFPGLFCCATYVGMQYSRIQSWKLAMCFLDDAQRMCPNDPLVLNEIAVLCVRNHERAHALAFLQKAVAQIDPQSCSEYRDCILFNIATVYRKEKQWELALQFYQAYVRCRPNAAHGYTALGFTYHLMGNMKAAIGHYHTAMSLKSEVFCRDMLDRALASEFSRGVGGPSWSTSGGGVAAEGSVRGGPAYSSVGSSMGSSSAGGGGGGGLYSSPAFSDEPHFADHNHHHRHHSTGSSDGFVSTMAPGVSLGGRHLFRESEPQPMLPPGLSFPHPHAEGYGPSPNPSVGRSLHF